ncbi:MAG: helix-turn-helix domain-containing protein [Methylophilaceae bacterium]
MARKPKKSEEIKENIDSEADLNVEVEAATAVNEASDGASDNDVSGCGGVLRAAREAQGTTVTDVANQLRLSGKQIEALEQDNFTALPEATIVKGFIRNYAKLLNIPTDGLLAAYTVMAPKKADYSFTLDHGINMKITEGKKSNKARYFLLLAGLLLGVGIWFFYQNYVQKPNPINPMPETLEALPELALPMSERNDEITSTELEIPEQSVAPVVGEQKDDASNNQLNSVPVAEEPTTVVADSEAAEETITETTENTQDAVPAPGKTRLEFSASQETWLSVINTSGTEVYNKILYAGNHDVVDVRSPAEIVVGNAHGATLIVNGKSIDLAPYTRVNVARVRVNRLP